jgi:hypothetical protein
MIELDEMLLFVALWDQPREQQNKFTFGSFYGNGRLAYLLQKWTGRGLWEYGTSPFGGWFEITPHLGFHKDWFLELGKSLDPPVKIWDFPVPDGINHVVARSKEEAMELLYAVDQYEAEKAPYRFWWKEEKHD